MPNPPVHIGNSTLKLSDAVMPATSGLQAAQELTVAQKALAEFERSVDRLDMYNRPQFLYSPLSGARRYDDSELLYDATRFDQEDFYAQNQGFFSSVGSGLGRLALTTLTKTGAGLGYIGAGLLNLVNGNAQDGFTNWVAQTGDNAFSAWFNGLEDQVKEDLLPIYQEANDRDKGFWSRALTDLNFWTDDLVDGVAFMASSLIPGMAISKLGAGARFATMLASLDRGARGSQKTAAALKTFFEGGAKSYETLNKLPKALGLINTGALARGVDVGVTSILSTTAEAMVEANEVRHQIKESLIGKINPNTGVEYTADEINLYAGKAAMETYKGNMFALALSNLWEANLLFKKVPSAAGVGGDKVKFGKKLFDQAEFTKPNYYKVFGQNAAKGIAAEGLWEENIQLAISRFNSSKYDPSNNSKKYSSSIVDNYLTQLKEGLTGEDKEAALSIGLGAILGGVLGGVMSTREDRAKDKLISGKVTQYNNIVDRFKKLELFETEEVEVTDPEGRKLKVKKPKLDKQGNPIISSENVNKFIEGHVESARLMEMMDDATIERNELKYDLAQNELLMQFALAHFEMGNAEGLKEKLSNMSNLSQEDMSLIGFDPSSKQEGAAKIPQILNKINQLEKLYNNIQKNTLDSPQAELKKRKLYDLGARQMFLVEQLRKYENKNATKKLSNPLVYELNRLNAQEKAYRVKADARLSMRPEREFEESVKNDEKVADENETTANEIKQKREQLIQDNKEELKNLSVDQNGFFYDDSDPETNALEQQEEIENLSKQEDIRIALEETKNRFDRIADPRRGDRYFKNFIIQQATDFKEKYKDLKFAAEDKIEGSQQLDNELRVILENRRYQPLVDLVPSILDTNMPLAIRIKNLIDMAQNSPLAQEILDAYRTQIEKFKIAHQERLKKEEEDRKLQEELQADKKYQEEINKQALKSQTSTPVAYDQDVHDQVENEKKNVQTPEGNIKDITKIASSTHNAVGNETKKELEYYDFLYNMSSSDPDKFNQADRDKMRILLVNKENADSIGLTGFPDYEAKDGDGDGLIVAVHVIIVSRDEMYYQDVNGKRTRKVGELFSLHDTMHTQMSSDSLTYADGKKRYTNHNNRADQNKYKEWWRNLRKAILGNKGTPDIASFEVSRGFINPQLQNNKVRNSVTKAGLVTEDDFKSPIISVVTVEQPGSSNKKVGGIGFANTMGVLPAQGSVNLPLGSFVLNSGGNILFLNNTRITEDKVDDIFKLIVALAEGAQKAKKEGAPSGYLDQNLLQYLNSILFFKKPKEKNGKFENVSRNQIWLSDGLHFVDPKSGQVTRINFNSVSILKNQDLLKAFLRNAYHQVDVGVLNNSNKAGADAFYNEYSVDKDGNPYIIREWKSYTHYLLSDKNPDGSDRVPPLTVPIETPAQGQTPISGKYIVLGGESYKMKEPKEQPEAKTGTQKSKAAATKMKQAGTKAKPKSDNTVYKTKNGVSYTVDKNGNVVPIKDDIYKERVKIISEVEGLLDDFEEEDLKELSKNDKRDIKIIVAEQVLQNAIQEQHDPNKKPVEEQAEEEEKEQQQETKEEEEDQTPPWETGNNEAEQKKSEETISTPEEEAATKEEIERLLKEASEDDNPSNLQSRAANLSIYSQGDYKVQDLDKELAWFKQRFPNLDVFTLKHLIRMTNGGYAWGGLYNGAVYLYENAEEGTLYHEAFEIVWNMFLQPNEHMSLYSEFKHRSGSFITFEGKKKLYSEASVKEAKEQMAEEFRDFILTGKRPVSREQRNIFAKILQWIREFFLGPQSELNDLFSKIDSGWYADHKTVAGYNPTQFEARSVKGAPEAFVQDTIQAMTTEFFGALFNDPNSIIWALEDDNWGTEIVPIYNDLRKRLDNYFRNEFVVEQKKRLKDATPEQQALIYKEIEDVVLGDGQHDRKFGWKFVNDHWGDFVKDHIKFIKTFGLVVNLSSSKQAIEDLEKGDITIEEDELGNPVLTSDTSKDEDSKNNREYSRDSFKLDVKGSASKFVKLLFATLADHEFTDNFITDWKDGISRSIEEAKSGKFQSSDIQRNHKNSLVRLSKMVSYAKVFNQVLHTSSNTKGIYDIIDKLARLATDPSNPQNANIYKLLSRLNFNNGFAGKNINQIKSLLKFENTLMKQKPLFRAQYQFADGSVAIQDSNLNSKTRQVIEVWIANLTGTKNVVVDQNDKYKFSQSIPNIAAKDNAGKLSFLRQIGIDIRDSEFEKLSTQNKTKLIAEATAIQGLVADFAKKGEPVNIYSSKESRFYSRLKNIANIYINNISGEDTESQHTNPDGERTSSFVLNNWASKVLTLANSAETAEDFFRMMPLYDSEYGDIFHRDSRLINDKIFNQVSRLPVQIGVAEGRISAKQDGTNIGTGKLSRAERLIYEFNNNLSGMFNIMINADGNTEWVINSGNYFNPDWFFGGKYPAVLENFANQMYQYLNTEIALARDFENRKDIDQLTKMHVDIDRQTGKSLRFFKDILPASLVKQIHERVVDNNEDLDNIVSEKEFKKLMEDYVKSKVAKTRKKLEKFKFVSLQKGRKDSYRFWGLLTDYSKKYFGGRTFLKSEEINNLIFFREMNYIVSNIEMHKVFFGDPAQYKDATKRFKSFLSPREDTHFDYIKTEEGLNHRLNTLLNEGLKEGDPGYHVHKNYLSTLTIKDVFAQSANIEQLKGKINALLAAKYEDINENDGASWISPTAYRELLYKAGGRFTTKQEELFQWHMAYERLSKEKKGQYKYFYQELKTRDEQTTAKPKPSGAGYYFPVLKPIGSGIEYKKGVARTNLIKTSAAPIFYEWVEGRQLEEVYNAMQENNVDYLPFVSAHKVGITNSSLFNLYNEDGTVNTEGFKKQKTETSFFTFGIQVETGGKKEDQTQGTQLNILSTLNLERNGVPVDFTGTREEWDNSKIETPLSKIIKENQQSLRDLTDVRYYELLKELNIKEGVDGKFEFTKSAVQSIRRFLLREVERRDLPRNIAEALESGDIELELLSNYKQLREILYSVVNNQIVRPKVSGSPNVQVPVTGWGNIKKTKVNGKDVYVSEDLKFYSVGEDGRTQACEIYLPNKFRGIPIDKIDAELLRGIGFRIPTQGLNSVESFVIKGFLPEDMGDVIILPSEITTKAGSDFDIDKLNVYLKNYYVDKEGNAIALKWQGDQEKTLKYLYELVEENNHLMTPAQRRELDRFIAEEMDSLSDFAFEDRIGDLFLNIKGIAELFSEKQITKDFIKNYASNIINELYKKTLENRYYDALIETLSLPQNFESLITPNTVDVMTDGSDGLKEISKKIAKLKGINRNSSVINYEQLLDSDYLMEERANYMEAKAALGIAVVGKKNHVINQLAGVYIKLPATDLDLPFDTNIIMKNGEAYISLGELTTAQHNILISNALAQFIDGFVDVAKGAWIIDMGANYNTASKFLLMVKMGIHPLDVALFMNQPIITELSERLDNERVAHSFGASRFRKGAKTLRREIVNELFPSKVKMTKPPRYERSDMENMIKKFYSGEPLTEKEKKLQQFIIEDFVTLDTLSWDLFRFINAYNYDTAKINDPNVFFKKDFEYTAVLENNAFDGIDRVFDRTLIGKVRERVKKLNDAFSQVAIRLHNGSSEFVLKTIAEDLFPQRGMTGDKYQAAMMKAELSLLNFLILTSNELKGKTLAEWMQGLFVHNSLNVAKWVKALKKSDDPVISKNPFIANLKYEIDQIEGNPSTVDMIERDSDVYTSNVYTDAIRELLSIERPITLAKEDIQTLRTLFPNYTEEKIKEISTASVSTIVRNLILASIVKNGVKRTSKSYTHLIPYENYKEYVSKIVESEDKLEAFIFNDVFFRTNWMDNTIVPNIPKRSVFDQARDEYVYFYEKEPQTNILRLDNRWYGNNKFMKTVEYKKKPDGSTDYSNPIITLYKRVENKHGDPITATRKVTTGQKQEDKTYVFFKPAIKWGSKKVMEMYPKLQPSVLKDNQNVKEEMTDMEAYQQIFKGATQEKLEELFVLPVQKENFEEQVLEDEGDDVAENEVPEYDDGQFDDQINQQMTKVQQPQEAQETQETNEIIFVEDSSSNYQSRTKQNAAADATIALAVDFTSAGEKLTKNMVVQQKKKYISVNANDLNITQERVDKIVNDLNSVNAKSLNIAGNGIYTMKGKYVQEQVDEFTYQLLKAVLESPNLKTKITSIVTGGQTGFDEAGAKAGIRLGIPTTIRAPKGWKFRNILGKDISNEEQFKARFTGLKSPLTGGKVIQMIPRKPEDDPNDIFDKPC